MQIVKPVKTDTLGAMRKSPYVEIANVWTLFASDPMTEHGR